MVEGLLFRPGKVLAGSCLGVSAELIGIAPAAVVFALIVHSGAGIWSDAGLSRRGGLTVWARGSAIDAVRTARCKSSSPA